MRARLLDKEFSFFIYLLEMYSAYKGIGTAKMYELWKNNAVIDYVEESYEMYHQESLDNALRDIDAFIETGKPLYQDSVQPNTTRI
jgi:hypothetical protein